MHSDKPAAVDLTFSHCWRGTSLLIINRRQATRRAPATTCADDERGQDFRPPRQSP
jgi:hypothetical protein